MDAEPIRTAAELYEALRRPFEPADLEWRAMFTGTSERGPWLLCAPYVNRPALINRLNQVCGAGGWQSQLTVSAGHTCAGVGILVDGTWVWRWDGTGFLEAEPPHFTASDAGKGDCSNAFKRACEQWGIALYLRELRPQRGILNKEGRYKAKIGGQAVRWDPPGIEGRPAYPGEIPGFDREEGGEAPGAHDAAPMSDPDDPHGKPPPAPKELTEEERDAEIRRLKDSVRQFMLTANYRTYHADAVVQTHPDLRARYRDAAHLGELGTLEDWAVLEAMTRRGKSAWDDAPKKLAQEYPTGPDRLGVLERLLDSVKVNGKERVEIESARQVGWNDAIEYWIEELGKR